jgi:hypothetical protein
MADASGAGQSPLAQFEIKPLYELELGGYDISFTNSALFMLIAFLLITFFSAAKHKATGDRARTMAGNG